MLLYDEEGEKNGEWSGMGIACVFLHGMCVE